MYLNYVHVSLGVSSPSPEPGGHLLTSIVFDAGEVGWTLLVMALAVGAAATTTTRSGECGYMIGGMCDRGWGANRRVMIT